MKRSGGLLLALLLCACGGGGNGGGPMLAAVTPPSAPVALTANVGDGAVSLGWAAVADDGGATVDGYDITLTPQPSGVRIEIVGRRALIRGLANGTAYTASVRARNRVGSGPAAQSAALTPRTTDVGQYQALTIAGDTSSSGIFDPSLLRTGANELWMAYSGVDYRRNAQSQLVQDVGISLARSTDNGATFAKVVSVGVPAAATVTDTDPARSTCTQVLSLSAQRRAHTLLPRRNRDVDGGGSGGPLVDGNPGDRLEPDATRAHRAPCRELPQRRSGQLPGRG